MNTLLLPAETAAADTFPGESAMAQLMRAHDWAATALAPPATWPDGLKVPLGMMLNSRFEMWLGWGPDLAFFYNDAYIPTLGGKHPHALGRPMREVWAEVFDAVADRIRSVMQNGIPTWDKALLLLLQRHGYPEETYHTFSYSPLRGAAGIEGLMCVVTEETERVITERRMDLLRALATGLLGARSRPAVLSSVAQALATNRRDFPFALLHLFDDTLAEPDVDTAGIAGAAWPFERIRAGHATLRIPLPGLLDTPPAGDWDRPPTEALIIPILKAGRDAPSGAMVLGLNPYRPQDPDIASYAALLAGQIAGALATVDAHQSEAAERERLRQLFAQSPSFMAVLHGPDHRFELVNPAYTQLVAGRDMVGQTVRDVMPEKTGPYFLDLLDQVYTTGEPFVGWAQPILIYRTPGAEPEERFVDFVYQPIRHEGAVTGIFVEGIDVTVGHEAVIRLRESEEQFRTFAELMPNQVWTSPPDGKLDWFNEQTFAYTGLSHEELAGTGWTAVVHPDDLDRAGRAWTRAITHDLAYEVEFRIRNHAGSYRWHLVRAMAIYDSAGRLKRWIGTNTDIHERRIAEARSARDLERSWTLSPVLKLIGTLDGTITATNPSWTNVLGWTEAETIGRKVQDFFAPEDLANGEAGMAQLAAGIAVRDYQNSFATSMGGRRRIAWTTVPENNMLYAFGRDVTAEVESARALAASNAEKERIWSSTTDLMGTAGLDGYLKSVNPAWARLLGHTEAELLGRPFAQIIATEDMAGVAAALSRLSAGLPVSNFEDRLIHKDGTRSLIQWSAEPFGQIFYIVGRNITEQRLAEDALRQSQKMEAVGQLTGGIAHDFNNLLQGITGSLDLVQKRLNQGRIADVDRFINGAMSSARRASALTHRLLAFSRRQPLDPRAVRANPLVASMEDLLRRTLGERVELELVLAGGLWLTLCDPNQLENAVLNLAINARDAMPDGGKLTIETCNTHLDNAYAAKQRDVRPGQYVCICVTDTGMGMTADTMAHAFEPFFTTKPIGQGTGLGLSMIYGFARQSEGYAKIYSELDRGTTFKLYLPRHRGEPEDIAEHTTQQPTPAEAGETVLVVEDEAVVRGLIIEILSDLGYHALEAADGPAGLALLQSRRRIDLLITDIGLPGLNGRQVADAGRQLRPGLRVLFMTGYAENAALASGFLEPGMAMITKPFAMEVLAARIRDIIEG